MAGTTHQDNRVLLFALFSATTMSAVFFVGEWLLLGYQPGIASIVLYLHMAIFGAILISGFWSIINERFDPHSAKQRVARIAAAAACYRDSESLVSFFTTFYAAVGVLGFLLQSLLGHRILQRFGIGTTIAILPAVIAMFGTVGSVVTQLWPMVILRGSHAISATSLFRSAFKLLYTPLLPHKKRPIKTIIDVASDRVGDLLGSGPILLLLLMPDLPTAAVTACAVLLALLVLLVVTRLNRGYINHLAHSLRKGVVRIEEHDIVDATTQQILAESNAYSEHEYLQSKIEAMQERSSRDRSTAKAGTKSEIDRHAQTVKDFCSNDTGLIRYALNSALMDIHLTPYLIPLLANDEVAEEVRIELRWLAPRITGQLIDAMLDPDLPLRARQRRPGVLEASDTPRAIDGLLLGMVDACFNVRFSCARALARMHSRDAQLTIDRQKVFSAIRDEIKVSDAEWGSHNLNLNIDDPPVGKPEIPIIHQNLEHVFTLLELTLDPDAVHISMQAAISTDANLRGTALEYLENVLSTDLYDLLVKRLGIIEESREGTRHLSEIISGLKMLLRRSMP